MFGTDRFDPTPSYRSLRWQSHILSYTNTIESASDIWVLGEVFAIRETATVYMDKPMEKDDLDWWLSYAPWESAEKEQSYLKAIETGLIPKLRPPTSLGETSRPQFVKSGIAVILANLAEGKEYLLPSNQREIYRETTGKKSIILRFRVGEETTDLSIGI
jgi:hypothetical protein